MLLSCLFTTRPQCRNVQIKLRELVDGLVQRHATPHALVYKHDGHKIPGLYHGLLQSEHSKLEGELCGFSTWTAQCINGHCSAGTYLSIEGSDKGQCTMVHKKIGPFQG